MKDLVKLAGGCVFLPFIALCALPLLLRPQPHRSRRRILHFHAVFDRSACAFRHQMELLTSRSGQHHELVAMWSAIASHRREWQTA